MAWVLYLPGGQGSLTPCKAYDPGSAMGRHALWPGASVNRPVAHVSHVPCPVALWNCPGAHGSGASAPPRHR